MYNNVLYSDIALDCADVARVYTNSTTTLPDSAAAERVFSTAAEVLTVRLCRTTDKTMDKFLFLRSVFKSRFERFQF